MLTEDTVDFLMHSLSMLAFQTRHSIGSCLGEMVRRRVT